MFEEEDDEIENQDEQSEKLKNTLSRYEQMIRNHDHYFFDVDALIHIIDHYIEAHEHAKAMEVASYAYNIHPRSLNFLLRQAQLFALAGEEEQAFKALDRVEQFNPYDSEVHLLRGSIYNKLENFTKAIENFKKAMLLSDMKDEIYLSLANTYQNMREYAQAFKYYKQAIKENPHNDQAYEEITLLYRNLNKPEEAIIYFQELINEDPYSFLAWYNLGDIYNQMELNEKAIEAFEYSILIKDDFVPAYLDYASVLALMGKEEEAIQKFMQTFEFSSPDPATYYNIAECYEKLEKLKEARTYYRKAVKLMPEMAQAWYGIAITLESEERWYECIYYIRKALQHDVHNAEYLIFLGDCEYKLNNLPQAEDAYKKAMAEEPYNADAWLAYSVFLDETGDTGKAIEITLQAVNSHPDESELLYRLVFLYYKNKQIKEAYSRLEIALEKDYGHHTLLFEMMPDLSNDAVIIKLIALRKK